MKSGWLPAAFAVALVTAPDAFAQEARLYCSGNEALVRFNNSSLPAGDRSRWTLVAPAVTGRCKLSDGSDVVMRARQTHGTAWGMSGANREAVYSLWVDGKKVVSREEFWPHGMRADKDLTTSHVLYASDTLQTCRYPRGELDLRKTDGITCERRSVNLAGLPKDPLEPADDADFGKITFASASNPAFCASFIARGRDREGLIEYGRLVRLGPVDAGEYLAVGVRGHIMPFADGTATALVDRDVLTIKVATFDLLNTGKIQTVVEFAGQHALFSGSFFMVRDGVADAAEVQSLVAASKDGTLKADKMEAVAPGGWRLMRSRDDDYTYHTVLLISGTAFVLATPFVERDGLDAVLYTMSPAFQPFTPVCTFQAVWPNL